MRRFLFLLFFMVSVHHASFAAHPLKVGISQIVEHPALDATREGLIEGLQEHGYKLGETLEIIYQNAQGNFSTSVQIAKNLASQNCDVLVGISTPSSQTLMNVTTDAKRYFGAVSDPKSAGLETSFTGGIIDLVPAEIQKKFITSLLPSAKRIGIIYNESEANSVSQVSGLEHSFEGTSIAIRKVAVKNSTEVVAACLSLIGDVDVIYVPNDNTAMSALEAIVKTGLDHNIPVLINDIESLGRGALAGLGVDRKKQGKMLAHLIHDHITNKKSKQDIIQSDDFEVVINDDVVRKLPNITLGKVKLK